MIDLIQNMWQLSKKVIAKEMIATKHYLLEIFNNKELHKNSKNFTETVLFPHFFFFF